MEFIVYVKETLKQTPGTVHARFAALRRFFGQFIGQDIPVELSAHCPHI